ncbi:group II intron reverse transcriptase/maturase [Serratia nevei]|uniref:group II intron reverse transcriptase/maturase n=1 Tax=Serratia nevei TaxID=2703794 RepID=UPI00331480AA
MVAHSATLVSALSHGLLHWHDIDWCHVEQTVRALQIRIAKACKANNWRKVKALQRMLVRSRTAKMLAIRRVTENRGKQTPGVDGKLWSTPESKWKAVQTLKRRGYHACPLRRVFIPKSNGKKRPLGIPTMQDRAMQALYLLALSPVAETTGDPNSYGFRAERSTADAMAQLFCCLSKKHSPQWVLEADIKGCFDHINHEWLLNHIPVDKDVLRKWLKAGVVHQGSLAATEEGTPQGGIISPTLANMALDGLEVLLKKQIGKNRSRLNKINVVRYADDFVITSSSKEMLEEWVKPWIEGFLSKRGLTLSKEKTQITHINTGFDFLGWNFRKYGGKLLIKPAQKNVQAFCRKVKETIQSNQAAKQVNLIRILNRLLKGWAQYHQPVVAKSTLHKVNAQIWFMLWQWARRRHQKKGAQWVKDRYFHMVGNRDWVFASGPERETTELALYDISSIPIRRHLKVKGQYNPFDPAWEQEGEMLRTKRMMNKLRYRRQIFILYREQQGRCALCETPITQDTGWQEHNLLPRHRGGRDVIGNRVLLHPSCHHEVHERELSVNKLACKAGL